LQQVGSTWQTYHGWKKLSVRWRGTGGKRKRRTSRRRERERERSCKNGCSRKRKRKCRRENTRKWAWGMRMAAIALQREVAFNIKVPTLPINSKWLFIWDQNRPLVPEYLCSFDTNYTICRNVEIFQQYFFLKKQIFVKDNRASFWNILEYVFYFYFIF
jgi:hypothetical protein